VCGAGEECALLALDAPERDSVLERLASIESAVSEVCRIRTRGETNRLYDTSSLVFVKTDGPQVYSPRVTGSGEARKLFATLPGGETHEIALTGAAAKSLQFVPDYETVAGVLRCNGGATIARAVAKGDVVWPESARVVVYWGYATIDDENDIFTDAERLPSGGAERVEAESAALNAGKALVTRTFNTGTYRLTFTSYDASPLRRAASALSDFLLKIPLQLVELLDIQGDDVDVGKAVGILSSSLRMSKKRKLELLA
jgi:hypothetical protein